MAEKQSQQDDDRDENGMPDAFYIPFGGGDVDFSGVTSGRISDATMALGVEKKLMEERKMAEGGPNIKDVHRLHMEPGDILVFSLDCAATKQVSDHLKKIAEEMVPGHKVIVLSKGVDLFVVDPEAPPEAT